MLRSFGARRCSGLMVRGVMYIVAGESKMMTFTEPSEPLHPPAKSLAFKGGWCVCKDTSFEVVCSSEVTGVGQDAVLLVSLG